MNSKCFWWFPAAILVYQNCTPKWHLHTKLYKSQREMFRQITQKLTVGHKDLDKLFIYLSFHFLSFFHWTVSSLFFEPYLLRHWQWKRSITVYLTMGTLRSERDGCKTRQEVNFQRGDMLRMLKPSSWCHHVALRTWVLRVWRSVQNVSIFVPVLKLNDDIFL